MEEAQSVLCRGIASDPAGLSLPSSRCLFTGVPVCCVPVTGVSAWLGSSAPSSLCCSASDLEGNHWWWLGWDGVLVGILFTFHPHILISLHFPAFKCSCHLWPIHSNSFLPCTLPHTVFVYLLFSAKNRASQLFPLFCFLLI